MDREGHVIRWPDCGGRQIEDPEEGGWLINPSPSTFLREFDRSAIRKMFGLCLYEFKHDRESNCMRSLQG